jgi:hypothetical protein
MTLVLKMIRTEKQKHALEAIHAVLVGARAMAASSTPYGELVAVLDVAEYLPRLCLRADDQTEHFRGVLADNADRFTALQAALERFDREGVA